jgi:mannose-1-phosphate guanylyltransferase
MNKPYACIMAGGSGERFWPLSRVAKPKHLVRLLTERTMLEETVRRVEQALPSSHIFVLTNGTQIEGCRAVLPHLKKHQFIAEPAKRDTAAACALGTALVRNIDPEAVVVFLPADALIKDTKTFAGQLKRASALAAKHDTIVTFGIRPHHASTRFGYLEAGKALKETSKSCPFFNVARFVEKTGTFLREAKRLKPELVPFIENFPKSKWNKYLAEKFPALPKISVDYAIMEKAQRVMMAEARFDWDDIGSWTALPKHMSKDPHGNTVRGRVTTHDSHNNIAISDKRVIALCGVRDLIIVETEDAILVCHRDAAEQVKQLHPNLPDASR